MLEIFILLVNRLFVVYQYIILARVLITWFPNLDPTHPVVVFLYRATEPVLRPFRNLMPTSTGIDFSPIIVFFLLRVVQQVVVTSLIRLL